ncbi:MAG TPA: pilus assembly protein TadG-related protein [Chloroflexota bacterium]|nr:pilus assembly protein TadG-related protein [Chloroflexota bacterium]
MARRHGQVLVLFGLLALVLIGFLGLAVDGGYYWATSRGATIAADMAARAAAVDVQRAQSGESAYYAQATIDGRAIGQRHLAALPLSGTNIYIEYNDTPSATPNTAGWSAGPPTASTQSVQARLDGSYTTMFLRAVGLPTLSLRRTGQGTPVQAGVTLLRVLPFGVCSLDVTLDPNGPWTVWHNSNSLCVVLGWHGLVNLDNRPAPTCQTYLDWIGPPAQGPAPSQGSTVQLDTRSCTTVGDATKPLENTVQLIPEISTIAGILGQQVVGCRYGVLSNVSTDHVRVTPQGGRVPCSIEQTY